MKKKLLLASAFLAVAAVLSVHAFCLVQPPDRPSHAPGNDAANRANPAPDPPDEPPAGQAAASTRAKALPELEKQILRVISLVRPAVVAVKNPESALLPRSDRHERSGSGVIISPEGLVLSQAHVSHVLKNDGLGNDGRVKIALKHQPGEKAVVILHDGRVCQAELLGADCTHDLSLLQLLEPGPYPHVPFKPDVRVRLGDWVLHLGHPLGYRRDRPAPVRLGRVLTLTRDAFTTDCLITSGDSGGPYFDLDGQLVGIIGPGAFDVPTSEDPVLDERASMPVLCSANPPIQGSMEALRRRQIIPYDSKEHNRVVRLPEPGRRLPVADWSQGQAVLVNYRSAVRSARLSTISILHDSVPIALGTVVGADGWVITKASELPPKPKCRLPDGRVVGARVTGIDMAFDLALLKVPATGLQPIPWAKSFAPEAGTLLAAVGPEELPLASGVVSVPRRELANPAPPSYRLPLRLPSAWLHMRGHDEMDRGYSIDHVRGRPRVAGVRVGDLLVSVAGHPIHSPQDLRDSVKDHRSGDLVTAEIVRDGKKLTLTLPLHAEEASDRNYRCDDFPVIFEHALPVFTYECGGPVVDLTGRAVGITIARVGRHGCMAVPGDCVLRLLPQLKAGPVPAGWNGSPE